MTDYNPDYEYDSDENRPMTAGELRRRARFFSEKLEAEGVTLQPVSTSKKAIATTFWGQAWNKNISKYSHFANQLASGRSLLRHGSVIDLKVSKGLLRALVAGSSLYDVEIKAEPLQDKQWNALVESAMGDIATLSDLLSGKISPNVIVRMVDESDGIFPNLDEITFSCTCPDWTDVCAHVAAVLYGFSVRLDHAPALFFELRGVDPANLVTHTSGKVMSSISNEVASLGREDFDDLELLFGIDIKR